LNATSERSAKKKQNQVSDSIQLGFRDWVENSLFCGLTSDLKK
jgi:hypothetical protein